MHEVKNDHHSNLLDLKIIDKKIRKKKWKHKTMMNKKILGGGLFISPVRYHKHFDQETPLVCLHPGWQEQYLTFEIDSAQTHGLSLEKVK